MKTQFRSQMWLGVVVPGLCGMVVAEGDRQQNGVPKRSTAEDFLELTVGPIAIGHHGVGPNPGENPGRAGCPRLTAGSLTKQD